MKLSLLLQKDWFKYGLYSAIAAFFIGISVYNLHSSWWLTGYKFYPSAPFGAFIICSLTWKWIFVSKEDYKIINIIIAGLISTFASIYLTFVIERLYSDEHETILESLFWNFPRTMVAFYELGIIIFPISAVIGFFVMKKSKYSVKIETNNLNNVSEK